MLYAWNRFKLPTCLIRIEYLGWSPPSRYTPGAIRSQSGVDSSSRSSSALAPWPSRSKPIRTQPVANMAANAANNGRQRERELFPSWRMRISRTTARRSRRWSSSQKKDNGPVATGIQIGLSGKEWKGKGEGAGNKWMDRTLDTFIFVPCTTPLAACGFRPARKLYQHTTPEVKIAK